jgi:hypothetical protein
MPKNLMSSPVDLLVERILLFLRLLGITGSAQRALSETPVARKPVARKPGPDLNTLGSRILEFLERMGKPVRKTDILYHIGKRAALDVLNEALVRLVKQGKIVRTTVARGQGRPAEMWSLVLSRRTKSVAAVRTGTGKPQAKTARKARAKIAKVVKAKIVESAKLVRGAGKTVREMSVPELGEKIWSFMHGRKQPLNRQVISGHLGHKVPARKINATLLHLRRRGRAVSRLVKHGSGRPAVLWTSRR